MKLSRVLSVALFLFISTSGLASASSQLNQVRNSLWSFGVSNSTTTEVEMIQQGVTHLSEQFSEDEQEQEVQQVPEELGMAIAKFES